MGDGGKKGFHALGISYMLFLRNCCLSMPFMIPVLFLSQQEYLENGPLFSELKFYQRAAKQEHSK